ncbi:MAG: ABC transporter, substrate-binding protein (cluster 11, riboflavin/purine nucleoside/unknown) [uncultured Nocardioidaceae bacterium]|uniref:ABC transporter substrate-binding protein PnrA-like domain-containing protein n=1 Tax=uncultured Nocardioidaceae bacterium TaxID=253824 RepID=A0A6J4LVT6_9ACTN|nr:MAG: ABC transporter, substrate-binding protein (cluster 11, riboflavin/purine nucleoside/unknown) [uncultured Nocardioidaceae bacterium]
MRRVTTIAALSAAVALTFTGCARQDDTGSSNAGNGGSESSASSADLCEQADGDGPKVALAYDVGGVGDQSFNDAAYAGVKKAVEDLDAQCFEGEAADGEPESAREERLRGMADQGYSPIIGVGFAYSESVNAVAPDYPDINFAVIDGFDPDEEPNDNVAYLGFAEEQGSFLVGAAAALKTQSDHVGFVGGVNNDLIQKFEAGFAAGAQEVNPKIKVDVTYIEESDLAGFADPAGGKSAAQGLYDKGADIVYHASGASGSGVFEAAAAAGEGNWAIGVDSDQYLTAPADQKQHILTSMLKRVDVATFNAVQAVADGEPLVSYTVYDLKADGVGYSTSGGFVDDITGELDGYAEDIKSGKIKVPTAP